eukprot:COSAG02_NODE_2206_length_9517_cov_3.928860_10_plen_83_part_00
MKSKDLLSLTGWVRIQSSDGVKAILIFRVICEKKQRFEAIRGVHGIDQCILHTAVLHTIPTQPVTFADASFFDSTLQSIQKM